MPKRCVIRCIMLAVKYSSFSYEVQSDSNFAKLRVNYPAMGRKEPRSMAHMVVQAKSLTLGLLVEVTKIYKSAVASLIWEFGRVISPH